jgi:hypothetical protein
MQNPRESSVFTFVGLVFVLSIPFWVLGILHPTQLLPGLPSSALAAFTPAVAGLILAYKHDRLLGVLQLLRRSVDFKRVKNRNWFSVILLINPVIAIFAYGVIGIVGEPLPKPAPLTLAIFPMLIFFFIGALGEEIGWSGYATEPLQQRWGSIGTGIFLGLVWAVWHFIPLIQAHRSAEWIAWWSLDTLSLRMIMTWLYIHSGKSVFAAAVFHAMINLSWQLFPINGSYYDPQVFGLITLCFAIAIHTVQWFLSTGKLHAV